MRNINSAFIPYDEIIGEGSDAKFLYGYNKNECSPNDGDEKGVFFDEVKTIKNVIFEPKYTSGTSISYIPNNTKNSSFIADNIYLLRDYYDAAYYSKNKYTAQGNTYVFKETFNVLIPRPTTSRNSFDYEFDDCKFISNAQLTVSLIDREPAASPGTYQAINLGNYIATVKFNSNCAYGTSPIDINQPFLKKGDFYNTDNISHIKFDINGSTFVYPGSYTWDPYTGVFIFY